MDGSRDTLFQGIYRSAAEGGLWSGLKQILLPRLRAHGLLAYRRERDSADSDWETTSMLFGEGFDSEMLESFSNYYHRKNVWAAQEGAMPPGKAVTSSMLFPDSELAKTEYYGDWLKPQDIFYAVGGVLHEDSVSQVKFSFVRAQSEGAYTAEDLELTDAVMPHVRVALEMQERMLYLESLAAAGIEALEQLQVGVFFLDASGALCFANPTGHAQLRRQHPLRLHDRRLVSDDPDVTQAIARAPGVDAVRGRLGAASVSVVRPPEVLRSAARVQKVVFVGEPRIEGQQFADEHGFTEAERQVFLLLLEGQGLREIGIRRGSSYHTVRSQIAAILAKTGARSQRELLARFKA
jgi:DNA-binding CsgD family transcriptional regulator